jgi:hypothetical protein
MSRLPLSPFLNSVIAAWLLARGLTCCADTTLIPLGSFWRYLDDGSDQGTAWSATDFNDSSWSNAPAELGYGDGDEATVIGFGGDSTNKYITTYFRRAFVITNLALVPQIYMRMRRDDGAVVYLNGDEVWRNNMANGAVDFLTRAFSALGPGVEEILVNRAMGTPPFAVVGTNILGCEIHQALPTSSDLSFDFELTVRTNELAISVVRGPYLQLSTHTGMVVRWRTDGATDSTVRFGIKSEMFRITNTISGLRTEHVVALGGLSACTGYVYSVGTTSQVLSGGDSNHVFTTAPIPGTPQSTRIWVLGDSGTANQNARDVRDAFATWSSNRPANLVLMLGDNAYNDGTDDQYQAAVFDTYPATLRDTVLWSTFGNHDGRSASSTAQSGPYYELFTFPRSAEAGGLASGTEAYYSFDYANIHFVCLNSFDINSTTGGTMMTWLVDDLALTTQQWIIAFWHHPPYSKGVHDSDDESELFEMRQNALPILEDAGVDLVLCGHSHSYERSSMIDGHYGFSSNFTPQHVTGPGGGREEVDGVYDKGGTNGAVYVVAGSSGQLSGGTLDHPVMHLSLLELGSVAIDVNTGRMDVTFIGNTPTERDRFTIVKDMQTWGLSATASGRGAVQPESGRYIAGASVTLTAIASNYFTFGEWTGDLTTATNPASIVMASNRAVTAVFEQLLVTNQVPLWWLAEAGLGTNDAAALDDQDGDFVATWKEFTADTDPTNANAFFHIGAISNGPGIVVTFDGSASRVYSLQYTGDLGTGTWSSVPGQTNIPGTGPAQLMIDTNVHPGRRHYRVRVAIP